MMFSTRLAIQNLLDTVKRNLAITYRPAQEINLTEIIPVIFFTCLLLWITHGYNLACLQSRQRLAIVLPSAASQVSEE